MGRDNNPSETSFADRRRAVLLMIRELQVVSLPLLVAILGLIALNVLSSAGFTVATGIVVGAMHDSIGRSHSSFVDFTLGIAILGLITFFVLSQTLPQLQSLLVANLGRQLEGRLQGKVMRCSVGLDGPMGLAHLEDPDLREMISKSQGIALGQYTPSMALNGLVDVISSRLQAILSALLISVYLEWWVGLGLLALLLFTRSRVSQSVFKAEDVLAGATTVLRRADYYLELALMAGPAKETRIFALKHWIIDRFRQHWYEAMTPLWKERETGTVLVVPWVIGSTFVAVVGAFILSANAGVSEAISLTALVVVSSSILNLLGNLFSFRPTERALALGALAIPATVEFQNRSARYQLTNSPSREVPKGDIRFEGVFFRYPQSGNDILANLDLLIPAKRSLAIVGANGVGKSTIVKLLCRLYDPTQGRITLDGVDIRDIPIDEYRKQLSVVFQDFVRYELPATENVGFGALERLRDHSLLEKAAHKARVEEIISRLPNGWDTTLSRKYRGGADLSGGEWQRIALARAYCAVENQATVLILDEPTANLDIRAESMFFKEFLATTQDVTVVLISHRFSTVRQADLICVLENGHVLEYGTHEELIGSSSRYAMMYNLQSSHFLE